MTVTSTNYPELTTTVPIIVLDADGNYNPFKDVKKDDWFYEAVMWANEAEIANGISAQKFGPRDVCTRAQIVTFLWNAKGQPTYEGTVPFTDVAEDAWYYDAVLWATRNGITNGVSDTLFAPGQTCTRAEAMGFLWKAMGRSSVETEAAFTDVDESAWYCDAVNWAVEKNITTGISDTQFGPDYECQRAQIVAFMYRLMGPEA